MSIKNRFNRFINKQKKAAAKRYFLRLGHVDSDYRRWKAGMRPTTRVLPNMMAVKLKKMTNWQNSQWLRAGGHTVNPDNDEENTEYFLQLAKD